MRRQINRIYRNTSDARFRDRASAAYGRYMSNITNSKTYQRGVEKVVNSVNIFDARDRNNELINRKYSRNTYMGLSNG